MSKTVAFKSPTSARNLEEWVQVRESAPTTTPVGPTKRLTVNIPEDLHRRLKLDCVQRGLMISDMVRDMLAERYPAAVTEPGSGPHAGEP